MRSSASDSVTGKKRRQHRLAVTKQGWGFQWTREYPHAAAYTAGTFVCGVRVGRLRARSKDGSSCAGAHARKRRRRSIACTNTERCRASRNSATIPSSIGGTCVEDDRGNKSRHLHSPYTCRIRAHGCRLLSLRRARIGSVFDRAHTVASVVIRVVDDGVGHGTPPRCTRRIGADAGRGSKLRHPGNQRRSGVGGRAGISHSASRRVSACD